jgi:prepilin-type N-terminal cleavage/methylation domain-containing protein
LSASKRGQDAHENGFTLSEALAALVVIGLAMAQVTEITGHLVRSARSVHDRAAASRFLLGKLVSLSPERLLVADEAEPPGIVLDGRKFAVVNPALLKERSCTFDTVGRRCR